MLKIEVMSKGDFHNKELKENTKVIYFYDCGDFNLKKYQNLTIVKNESLLNLMEDKDFIQLEINDAEITKKALLRELNDKYQPIKLFKKNDAMKIINFVKNKKNYNFIFVCDYGRSRSLTTAIFCHENILKNHEFINNERIIRNKSIYKILRYTNIH